MKRGGWPAARVDFAANPPVIPHWPYQSLSRSITTEVDPIESDILTWSSETFKQGSMRPGAQELNSPPFSSVSHSSSLGLPTAPWPPRLLGLSPISSPRPAHGVEERGPICPPLPAFSQPQNPSTAGEITRSQAQVAGQARQNALSPPSTPRSPRRQNRKRSPPRAPRCPFRGDSCHVLKALRENSLKTLQEALVEDPEAARNPILDGGFVGPPLCVALRLGCDASVVALLLRHGADANAADGCLRTPLSILCSMPSWKSDYTEGFFGQFAQWREEQSINIARQLLLAGANTTTQDEVGRFPEDIARVSGNHHLVGCLRSTAVQRLLPCTASEQEVLARPLSDHEHSSASCALPGPAAPEASANTSRRQFCLPKMKDAALDDDVCVYGDGSPSAGTAPRELLSPLSTPRKLRQESPSTPRCKGSLSSPPPAPRASLESSGCCDMFVALRQNTCEAVQKILHEDPEAAKNLIMHEGFVGPPLCVALRLRCKPSVVELLLDHGADANGKDAAGRAPLSLLVSQPTWRSDLAAGDLEEVAARMELDSLLVAQKLVAAGAVPSLEDARSVAVANGSRLLSHFFSCEGDN